MNFNNILFLDIETVSQVETYDHLDHEWKELWDLKTQLLNRYKDEPETSESIYHRAAIYAEFGKIVCISCGYVTGAGEDRKLIIKSYCGDDEKSLLHDFCSVLNNWGKDNERLSDEDKKYLCAHNGREFDYPYLCRRLIINSISLPNVLMMHGKKPWQICHYDTLDLWKFGDYKSYTSLKLLAKVLGIPSPKDDIDGSMVNTVYWVEKDLHRIVEYCQKDVITLAQVLLRFHCEPLIKTENISIKYVQQNQY